jgi:hypothetical protein
MHLVGFYSVLSLMMHGTMNVKKYKILSTQSQVGLAYRQQYRWSCTSLVTNSDTEPLFPRFFFGPSSHLILDIKGGVWK